MQALGSSQAYLTMSRKPVKQVHTLELYDLGATTDSPVWQ